MSRKDDGELDLNLIERKGLQLAGWKVRRMKSVKRWVPLIGVAVLVAAELLKVFGQADAAQALTTLGGLLGFEDGSGIPKGEIAAAVAAGTGLVLKIASLLRAARG